MLLFNTTHRRRPHWPGAGTAAGVLLVGAVALPGGGLAGPAHAQPAEAPVQTCTDLPTIEASLLSSDLVVLGTVVSVRSGGRWATLTVDETWKGSSGGSLVEVRSGAAGTVSVLDRTYQPGQRYLVFAVLAGGAWTDTNCSPTRTWTDDLTRYRPPDVVTKQPGSVPSGGISASTRDGRLPPSLVAAAVVAVIAAAVVVARRRRQPAAS